MTAVGVHANRPILRRIAALADQGQLTPRVAHELPLNQAADAHRLVEKGGRRGAVVLHTTT